MQHIFYIDLDKLADGIKLVLYFPYILLPITGILFGKAYQTLMRPTVSTQAPINKARRIAANWGAWAAFIIYLLPCFDENDHTGLGHLAAKIFGLKSAAWLYLGILPSVFIGAFAWLYLSTKPFFERFKKPFNPG